MPQGTHRQGASDCAPFLVPEGAELGAQPDVALGPGGHGDLVAFGGVAGERLAAVLRVGVRIA